MNQKYRIEGITDERDTCDCCGRTNLKRTVVMRHVDTHEFEYFGTTCAAHMLKIPAANVARGAKEAQRAKEDAIRKEKDRIRDEHTKQWFAFLRAETGGGEVIHMIEKLGGIVKAKELFKSKTT
jgi:Cys-tRNA synthase (O-phospho-L-seryl-tRNA:Cys-tRNA synthase)